MWGTSVMTNSERRFDERCYELLNQIPEGKVTTYREIANALNTKAWRAVGSAMANNKKFDRNTLSSCRA